MGTAKTYGYGPADKRYPTIVGFDTLQDAQDTARAFFEKGWEWSKKDNRYISVADGTKRTATIYEILDHHNYIVKGRIIAETKEGQTTCRILRVPRLEA